MVFLRGYDAVGREDTAQLRLSLGNFGIALTPLTMSDQRGAVCYVIVIANSIDLAALIY